MNHCFCCFLHDIHFVGECPPPMFGAWWLHHLTPIVWYTDVYLIADPMILTTTADYLFLVIRWWKKLLASLQNKPGPYSLLVSWHKKNLFCESASWPAEPASWPAESTSWPTKSASWPAESTSWPTESASWPASQLCQPANKKIIYSSPAVESASWQGKYHGQASQPRKTKYQLFHRSAIWYAPDVWKFRDTIFPPRQQILKILNIEQIIYLHGCEVRLPQLTIIQVTYKSHVKIIIHFAVVILLCTVCGARMFATSLV